MAIQQPDVDVLERCRKHIGTAHVNETDAADEIERLRGLLNGLVHLHDTDRIVQAHKLLGRINAIVKSYQSPDATAGKLLERMQTRKET